LALALSMAAVGAFCNLAAAEPPGIPGVLILRNGSVLVGTIRRYGDDYRIDVAGAMLQVPADQVDMFSQTLEEAYELRRRDRTGASADSHLELARWCMQLDLLGQAARELLDARTIDPKHSALPGLETRLRQMIALKQSQDAAGGPGESTFEPSKTAEAMGDVKSGTDERPASETPAFDISEEAQSQFVRSIQPMLIRGCTTGGCHQPAGAQTLQLDRWALEGNGNAEMVRRNLASVLGAVNDDDPSSSALLQWARQSHGGKSGPASKSLSAYQTAILLEWINDAAGIGPVVEAEADEADTRELPDSREDGSVSGGPVDDFATLANGRDSFEPRDAFDPEIFNRGPAAGSDAAAETVDDQADSAEPSEPSPLGAE
jgi:hypothetical protein